MTLDKLQTLFPSATAETWHQHVNPAGWDPRRMGAKHCHGCSFLALFDQIL